MVVAQGLVRQLTVNNPNKNYKVIFFDKLLFREPCIASDEVKAGW